MALALLFEIFLTGILDVRICIVTGGFAGDVCECSGLVAAALV